MKTLVFASIALALTAPVSAQDSLTITGQGGSQGGRARSVLVTSNDPEWFTKTIDLDIKNATLEDAIKKIMDAAKVKVEKVDDQSKGNKSKLSLKLDDVNVRDALAAVSRLYGAQAYVLSEDGKTIIELRKRTVEPITRTLSGAIAPFSESFSSATGFGPGSIFINGNTERYKDLPEKKLDIEVKDGTTLDVIKQICEKAGLDYELDKDVKPEGKVSIVMRGASVGQALDNAAGWLGCGWKAEKKGDKVRISFSKKLTGPGFRWNMAPGGGQAFAPSVPFMSDIPVVGNLFRIPLSNKRVSLDKKNADVRECLSAILKEADISYALADDLPSDAKSFTFSNVPITLALDMICESIDVGWTTENGSDGKPVIRVGKRYKGRARSTGGQQFNNLTRTVPPSLTRFSSPRGFRPTHRIPVDFFLQ